jgi:arginyl-tRNA synthetase
VIPVADLRFGDYQSNAAMVLAKQRKTNPRTLAQSIIDQVDLAGLATAEIAGPGFLNFRVLPAAYEARAVALLRDERLGVPAVGAGHTVVVDFSGPNVAKPMHVGHIRSTIIGDSLARIARFLGFQVIADNHLGDWGTQFGMILHGWKTLLDAAALEADPITELVRVYRDVNAAAKAAPELLEQCKAELVKLQAGDAENLAIWQQCIDLSKLGLQKIYTRLDVTFDHWLGESFYNDRLAALVARSAFSPMAPSRRKRIRSRSTRKTAGPTTRRSSAKPTVGFSMRPPTWRPSNSALTNGGRTKSGMWWVCPNNCISASSSKPPPGGAKRGISGTSRSARFSVKTGN